MKPNSVLMPHLEQETPQAVPAEAKAPHKGHRRAEYRIIDGPNGVAELELRVNDMLDRGWKLIGGLCFDRGCAYQAMARVTTDPVEPTVPPPTLTAR